MAHSGRVTELPSARTRARDFCGGLQLCLSAVLRSGRTHPCTAHATATTLQPWAEGSEIDEEERAREERPRPQTGNAREERPSTLTGVLGGVGWGGEGGALHPPYQLHLATTRLVRGERRDTTKCLQDDLRGRPAAVHIHSAIDETTRRHFPEDICATCSRGLIRRFVGVEHGASGPPLPRLLPPNPTTPPASLLRAAHPCSIVRLQRAALEEHVRWNTGMSSKSPPAERLLAGQMATRQRWRSREGEMSIGRPPEPHEQGFVCERIRCKEGLWQCRRVTLRKR